MFQLLFTDCLFFLSRENHFLFYLRKLCWGDGHETQLTHKKRMLRIREESVFLGRQFVEHSFGVFMLLNIYCIIFFGLLAND